MSAIDKLVSNLKQINVEVQSKVLSTNIRKGITLFGVEGSMPDNCRTFATIEEMNAYTTAIEDDYAIVYGTTYVGTYRYDAGEWVQIGDSSDEQKIMDVLNQILLPVEQYEGNGGTDEEISAILDKVLNGPPVEPEPEPEEGENPDEIILPEE